MVKNLWSRLFQDVRISKEDHDSFVLKKQSLLQEQALGKNGHQVVTGTSVYGTDRVTFSAIQFLEDSIFSTLEGEHIDGDPTAVTYPKGLVLVGHFTSIQLSSGSAIAYYSTN